MRPTAADQVFRVEVPPPEIASQLQLTRREAVLRVDRTLSFPLADSAIHARMLCRTDRFQFSQRIGGNAHG
jgi:GntR family transcriptional regulator